MNSRLLVVAALPGMLEHDRKQTGWSVGQAAWRLGITVREYRELEAAEELVAPLEEYDECRIDSSRRRRRLWNN